MTYKMLTERLKNCSVDEPKHEAMLLLDHFFCVSPAHILTYPDKEYPDEPLIHAIEKRKAHVPLQYIIGTWGFYGNEFFVSPDCLIPREDTEVLIDAVLSEAKRKKREGQEKQSSLCFADLCTGSGCIAITLCRELPKAKGIAVDLSQGALKVAEKNSDKHKMQDRLTLCEGDIFASFGVGTLMHESSLDFIVSNPPYIESEEVKKLAPELFFEPIMALDGGADGLDFYRAIIKNYSKCLKQDGFFAFEIGFAQGNALIELAGCNSLSCEILKDLSGNDRVAVLRKKA